MENSALKSILALEVFARPLEAPRRSCLTLAHLAQGELLYEVQVSSIRIGMS